MDNMPQIPHIEQYFGLWAVEPDRFRAMIEHLRAVDMDAHVAEQQPIAESYPIVLEGGVNATWDPEKGYLLADGVAVIDISGTITKKGSSFSRTGATAYARRKLALAVRDTAVQAIVLRIDSPGGTVAGTGDLASDLADANKIKPVTAYIEDLGASAAYWIASQAGRVFANESALVGSIGVLTVVRDYSAIFAKAGVKIHVIKAGEFKGMGAEGTEFTDEQRAEVQRSIDETYGLFVGAISRGRRMTEDAARALADGRIWHAAEAKKKGLIDGISTLAEAVSFARHEPANRSFRAESTRRQHAMNFSDAIKAVLEGKPEAAADVHRQIAIDAVAQVRAFDKPGHEQATADAVNAAKASATPDATALQARDQRAADIVEVCGKLNLGTDKTAAHIKGGKSLDEVRKEAIDQSATAQPPLRTAGAKHDASQPDQSEEQKAADESLLSAAKDLAGTK